MVRFQRTLLYGSRCRAEPFGAEATVFAGGEDRSMDIGMTAWGGWTTRNEPH